jgi:tetratricopeptide (TPR) repeat protein
MSASIGLFTLLAMYSKENGILLPLLVGVLEITILASARTRVGTLNRYWAVVFIVVPSAVVLLYLGGQLTRDDFFEIVPPRDYSVYERLLTQWRVLVVYLKQWFIPELYTSGVYQDHILKSTGILSPLTTLFGALFHVALVSVSLLKRRDWPLFAFAVLFFYGGHVLESSVLNLELYFEHRNYTTAAFLFLPLVVVLRKKASETAFFVVAATALLMLGGFTRYSATIWQSFPSIVEASAHKAPTSARAQAQFATQLFNAARYEESLQVIDKAIQVIANDHPVLLINRLIIRCQMGLLSEGDFKQVADVVSRSYYDARSIKLYESLTESVITEKCPEVTAPDLRDMYEGMLDVPINKDPLTLGYSHINYFIGYASVYADEPERAVAAFEQSLRSRPGASHAMIMAAHLATRNFFDEALYLSDTALEQFEAQQLGILEGARVTAEDIRAFQAVVRADRDAERGGEAGASSN